MNVANMGHLWTDVKRWLDLANGYWMRGDDCGRVATALQEAAEMCEELATQLVKAQVRGAELEANPKLESAVAMARRYEARIAELETQLAVRGQAFD